MDRPHTHFVADVSSCSEVEIPFGGVEGVFGNDVVLEDVLGDVDEGVDGLEENVEVVDGVVQFPLGRFPSDKAFGHRRQHRLVERNPSMEGQR